MDTFAGKAFLKKEKKKKFFSSFAIHVNNHLHLLFEKKKMLFREQTDPLGINVFLNGLGVKENKQNSQRLFPMKEKKKVSIPLK